jgi:peroxiredoxin
MIKNQMLLPLTAVAVGFGILLGACQGKKTGGFTVNGTFVNADKLSVAEGALSKVYLVEIPFDKDTPPVALDSAKLSTKSGSFTLKGASNRQRLLEVVFGDHVMDVPLVNDSPEVSLRVDLGKKDDFYQVEGSQASEDMKNFLIIFGRKDFATERAGHRLDSIAQSDAPDSVKLGAREQMDHAMQDLNTYLKEFINTNPNPVVCGLAMTWATRSFTMPESEASLNMLMKKFPGDPILMGLKDRFDQQMAALQKQYNQAGETIWTGKEAPELSLPDAAGHSVSISSFRGKYLLVDFWASWCGPCRAENPNVVKAYQEFKGKNFAILGVSLDKEKDSWQEAIHHDGLEWTQVSDLKYWNSLAVSTFQFQGIPYNILIDPQGKVIGEGLRGQALEMKLAQVLK